MRGSVCQPKTQVSLPQKHGSDTEIRHRAVVSGGAAMRIADGSRSAATGAKQETVVVDGVGDDPAIAGESL